MSDCGPRLLIGLTLNSSKSDRYEEATCSRYKVLQCVHCVALLATVRVRREEDVARVVCCTCHSNLQRVAVCCSTLQ